MGIAAQIQKVLSSRLREMKLVNLSGAAHWASPDRRPDGVGPRKQFVLRRTIRDELKAHLIDLSILSIRGLTLPHLREQFFDYCAMDVRQPEVAPLVAIG